MAKGNALHTESVAAADEVAKNFFKVNPRTSCALTEATMYNSSQASLSTAPPTPPGGTYFTQNRIGMESCSPVRWYTCLQGTELKASLKCCFLKREGPLPQSLAFV